MSSSPKAKSECAFTAAPIYPLSLPWGSSPVVADRPLRLVYAPQHARLGQFRSVEIQLVWLVSLNARQQFSSSSQARRSLSCLTCASKASRSLMTLRYSLQSASKLTSLTANRRTRLFVLRKPRQQCSDAFDHPFGLHLQGMNRTTGLLRVPYDAFPGPTFGDFGLGLHISNLIDDFGVGQRRDVAFILVVRDRREHAAHDLAGTGLRHVGHDQDTARAGNGSDLTDHGLLYSLADVLARLVPGLQRYVEVRDLAFDLVSGGDHGCLGDLLHQQTCRLDLLRPEPVSGDVDDIVDSTLDAIVAVGRLQSTVAGHVWPVAPVLTVPVLAVARIVLLDVAIGVFPDRLERARPRVLDTDVSGAAGARRDFVAVLVIDDRMNAGHAWPRASRFHRMKGRRRAAQEPAIFSLPPGVNDGCPTLAHRVVIPPPHRRLDRFAHRGHVLETVMIFRRLVGPGTPKCPYRGRRGVKDVDVEFFGDPPRTPGVGMSRKPLVHNRGGGEGQRPVDNIGMTGDPADIGHAPVDVLGMDVLNVFRRSSHVGEVSPGAVLAALGLPSGAARIHQE